MVTLMFSCFLHHSFGRPVPARVDGVAIGSPSTPVEVLLVLPG